MNAIEYAQNRNIQIALSNPCIELWFLLHFKQQRSNISRSEALEQIQKHIKDYEKKGKVFTFLEDKLPRAIKHAKQLNEMHERDGTPLLCCNSNPSSQVFELVEFIQYLIDKNTNN